MSELWSHLVLSCSMLLYLTLESGNLGTQYPNPKLSEPELAGTRKFGSDFGYQSRLPNSHITRITRPERSGKPERPE